MTSGFLQLVGRIEQSLADLQMIVSRAGVLVDKYRLSLDDGYLGGVALNLQEGPKVACYPCRMIFKNLWTSLSISAKFLKMICEPVLHICLSAAGLIFWLKQMKRPMDLRSTNLKAFELRFLHTAMVFINRRDALEEEANGLCFSKKNLS